MNAERLPIRLTSEVLEYQSHENRPNVNLVGLNMVGTQPYFSVLMRYVQQQEEDGSMILNGLEPLDYYSTDDSLQSERLGRLRDTIRAVEGLAALPGLLAKSDSRVFGYYYGWDNVSTEEGLPYISTLDVESNAVALSIVQSMLSRDVRRAMGPSYLKSILQGLAGGVDHPDAQKAGELLGGVLAGSARDEIYRRAPEIAYLALQEKVIQREDHSVTMLLPGSFVRPVGSLLNSHIESYELTRATRYEAVNVSRLGDHYSQDQVMIEISGVDAFPSPYPPGDMTGQTVFIPGGSRGIGEAIARRALASGAYVVVAGRTDSPHLRALSEETGVGTVAMDVTSDAEVQSGVAQAAELCDGQIDAVVYCAGKSGHYELSQATARDFEEQFQVHVYGFHRVMQAVHPHITKPHGQTLYMSSIRGQLGGMQAGVGPYAAAKAAGEATAVIYAHEWAQDKVGVNIIAPGGTITGMAKDTWTAEGIQRTKMNLMGRPANPWQVADPVVGILSQASHITGQRMTIDGGDTLVGPR